MIVTPQMYDCIILSADQIAYRLNRFVQESKGGTEQSVATATMAFTGLVSAIVLASFAVLKVEGTAKGAVPLDTLTFDKVFL